MNRNDILSMKGRRIAFDLDKTLTLDSVSNWVNYNINDLAEELYKLKPNKVMIDFLNKLSENNTIYIYTARSDYRQELTYKWLKIHGVNFKYLQHNKNHYDAIIDDLAFNALDLMKEIQDNGK